MIHAKGRFGCRYQKRTPGEVNLRKTYLVFDEDEFT
jgi:hypothetical protein